MTTQVLNDENERGQPGDPKINEAATISNAEGIKGMMVLPDSRNEVTTSRSWNNQVVTMNLVSRHLMRYRVVGSGSVRRECPICLYS